MIGILSFLWLLYSPRSVKNHNLIIPSAKTDSIKFLQLPIFTHAKAGIHFQRTFQYPNQSILICHSKSPYCSVFWLQSSKLYIFLLKYKRHTSTKFYYSSWISLLYLSIFPNISRIEFEGHSINMCLLFLQLICFHLSCVFIQHNLYQCFSTSWCLSMSYAKNLQKWSHHDPSMSW